MNRIYLDNAATTPLDPRVWEEMLPYFTDHYGNPSSIHYFGRKPKAAIEKARKQVAAYLNASTSEIFFTSGGTESNNTALYAAVNSLKVTKIVTTKIEHDCVLNTSKNLAKRGVELVFLDVNQQGELNLQQLEKCLSDKKKTLVSIMHVNNELGTVNDINTIAQLCEEYEAYFHSDTVQSIGYFPFDMRQLNIHFLSGSAHKFHGPKGCGFLYIKGNIQVSPLLFGGGQERNMRAGTENVAGIVGLGKAIELAQAEMNSTREHINMLRTKMKKLLEESIDNVVFYGNQQYYFPKILHVSLPPHPKNEMLLMNLDMAGIAASGGSACSSGTEKESHVLNEIGFDEKRKSVRFSFSKFNTPDEIEKTANTLASWYSGKIYSFQNT
jgi:cysteine desulfurase